MYRIEVENTGNDPADNVVVTERVRWEASVRRAMHMGITAAYEVGHGRVLAGLIKRIDRGLDVSSLGSPADIDVLKDGAL